MPNYDPDRLARDPALPPRRGESSPLKWILAVLAIVVVLGGAWYLLRRSPTTPEVAETPAAPSTELPADAADAAPTEPLPPLDASDEFVRERIAAVSSDPELRSWLGNDDLVRRFVGTAVAIGEGNSLRRLVPFLTPREPFQVRESDGRIVVAPESYARYDRLTAAIESIDNAAAARLLRLLHPLLERAHDEVARPGVEVDTTLARAVDALLAVPVPSAPLEVVAAKGAQYKYADPALEGLSPAQKHLLRTGPENQRRIQAKLRELRPLLR